MPHITRTAADSRWTPESDWDARAEASARRAEMAHMIAGGMLTGAHLDYLSLLDADDPRILDADFPPLMPTLLRAFRDVAKRALTGLTRTFPMMHPKNGPETDARHAGADGADPFRRVHA